MNKNYPFVIGQVLGWEGGYTNDPRDPGGPTNWGITIHDARTYWKKDATATDVKNMPKSVALQIYKSKYWDMLNGDQLPSGVDYAVMDYGVNSGIYRAARVLQKIVGTTQDGVIGLKTIAAAKKMDPVDVVKKICDERLAFLKSLKTWSAFGRGWARRVAGVRADGIKLAQEQ